MQRYRSVATYAVVALVSLALGAAGGIAFASNRSNDNTALVQPLSDARAPKVPPACTKAIERADASITVADRVADELAQHTKVMDDLIASMAGVHNGMTAHKALSQGMTSINNGRKDRRVFSEAKARYADVKQACGSQ
jgi:membrane-bound lytic murein transglycosylase B